MTSTLVTGIGELVTNEESLGSGPLGLLTGAALVVDDGVPAGTGSPTECTPGPDGGGRPVPRVAWAGPASRAPAADQAVDLAGSTVLPGFVDSHTHLVFAGDRAGEFAARMAGERYDGGGIAATVAATRDASEEQLRSGVRHLLAEARAQGTTTVEVKSGYALDVVGERRLLHVAAEVTAETTFLGGHVVPPEYAGRADDYVDLVRGAMLAACAPLARWVDVFCEPASPHAFDADQARAILTAGRAAGLGVRVHAGQLGPGPGVALATELDAASVDHCTHLTPSDVDALAGSRTVATLLPAVEFSTRSPYPDARALLDAGVVVALATDCNPGTSFTTSMPLCVALAVREMGMTPAEAVWAATAGGARALRRDDVGHLGVGARADLAVLHAPSHVHLAYRPGVHLVRTLDVA